MSDQLILEDQQAVLQQLINGRKTASLSTLNKQGLPEVSLVPFVYYQHAFWVYVSRLSQHTQNLLEQKYASLLIHGSEDTSTNAFAIQRLIAECNASEFNCRQNGQYAEEIFQCMSDRLGKTVDLLSQLPDFHLFSLTPKAGRLITGFGKAFTINFEDLTLTHINPSMQ